MKRHLIVDGDRYNSDPEYRKEVEKKVRNFRAWNIKQDLKELVRKARPHKKASFSPEPFNFLSP